MNRAWMRRWLTSLLVLAALMMVTSGCAGSVQPMSWMGLTLAEGELYVADLERVQVLNASDGSPVWSFETDAKQDGRGMFYVTPAVDEERVIVASQMPPRGFFGQPRHIIFALDRDTGAELWRFEGAHGQYVEGGALGGGLFVVGNSDRKVYALDVETGAVRWVFETGYHVWATPLIVSDTVYVGSMDRHFYALRLSNGQKLWDLHADGAFAGTPALRDGTLYVGAFDDRLYAVEAQKGTERWHLAGENWFWGGPAVYGDVVYAPDVNGNVYAVNAETGTQIWRRSLGAPVRAGPALAEDGTRLFVGGQNGTLYALDTADGFVVWSSQGEGKYKGQVLSTPVVSEAAVYVTVIQGTYRIRALHVENGRQIWAYPPVVEEQ